MAGGWEGAGRRGHPLVRRLLAGGGGSRQGLCPWPAQGAPGAGGGRRGRAGGSVARCAQVGGAALNPCWPGAPRPRGCPAGPGTGVPLLPSHPLSREYVCGFAPLQCQGTLRDGAATRHPHGSPGRSSWLHGPFSWKLPCPSSAVQARDTPWAGVGHLRAGGLHGGELGASPYVPIPFPPHLDLCCRGSLLRPPVGARRQTTAADGRPQFLILQNGTTGQAPAPNPPPAPPLGLHCEVLSHFSGLSGESLPPPAPRP